MYLRNNYNVKISDLKAMYNYIYPRQRKGLSCLNTGQDPLEKRHRRSFPKAFCLNISCR